MTIELPVLRLGLAGFSVGQRHTLSTALSQASAGTLEWEFGPLDEADACWVNGARVEAAEGDAITVLPGDTDEQAVEFQLTQLDRPMAFTLPLASPVLHPIFSFDASSAASISAVLAQFEAWLQPLTAQFALASHLVEHQSALGRGIFDVMLSGRLLAVVDMYGEVGVLPGVNPHDFEDAEWRRRESGEGVPEDFARTTLSQLMWNYSVRTQRDLLPRHYRTGLIYFRRLPRLPNRALRESHQMLLRELETSPFTFEALLMRSGMPAHQLAHDLAALYFVGSITSNARRAAPLPSGRRMGEADSSLFSGMQSQSPSGLQSGLPSEPPAGAQAGAPSGPAPLRQD